MNAAVVAIVNSGRSKMDRVMYFLLSGSSQASHIPVLQYLLYGSTANF